MTRMKAKYAGTCRWCGTTINVDTDILWSRSDGAGHVGCKPSANPSGDREYWAGRKDADLYLAERAIYGEELAEQWEIERELQDPYY